MSLHVAAGPPRTALGPHNIWAGSNGGRTRGPSSTVPDLGPERPRRAFQRHRHHHQPDARAQEPQFHIVERDHVPSPSVHDAERVGQRARHGSSHAREGRGGEGGGRGTARRALKQSQFSDDLESRPASSHIVSTHAAHVQAMLKRLLRWTIKLRTTGIDAASPDHQRADGGDHSNNVSVCRSFSHHDGDVVSIVGPLFCRRHTAAAASAEADEADASTHGGASLTPRRSLECHAVQPQLSPASCRDVIMRASWTAPLSTRTHLISTDSLAEVGSLSGPFSRSHSRSHELAGAPSWAEQVHACSTCTSPTERRRS